MGIKKNYLLMSVMLVLFLIGCGKKKKESAKMAFADIASEGNIVSADSQGVIPVLEEKVEDYLDDDSISEFAFVDEEAEGQCEVKDLFDEQKKKSAESSDLAMESLENKLNADEFFDEEEFDVAWEEEEKKADFQTVYFDLNKNNIRVDQKERIEQNVKFAKAVTKDGKKIVVGGHGCQLGSPSYNLALSERRAQAIKKEMVKKGVPEEDIKTIGYGQEMPVVWTDKTDREAVIKELAPNRRAEIFSAGS